MMNELIAEAKGTLGLYSIWLDDGQYEAIINAVLDKASNYSEEDASTLAVAASTRLNRILRICREIKWTGLGEPAMKDNATRAALHDLACLMMQDSLKRASECAGA